MLAPGTGYLLNSTEIQTLSYKMEDNSSNNLRFTLRMDPRYYYGAIQLGYQSLTIKPHSVARVAL